MDFDVLNRVIKTNYTGLNFTRVEEKLTRSEMKSLLANSRNDGAIDISEFAMMQGLSLDTKLAREVMVPRTDTLMPRRG